MFIFLYFTELHSKFVDYKNSHNRLYKDESPVELQNDVSLRVTLEFSVGKLTVSPATRIKPWQLSFSKPPTHTFVEFVIHMMLKM